MQQNGEQSEKLTVDLLVVGGGIAGITTAVEASEAGLTVALVEREAFLGGRVAQLNQYFPKLCPPTCGLEINFRRIRQADNIEVLTLSSVEEITGGEGAYQVRVVQKPRYVRKWAGDYSEWSKSCPVELDDPYNLNLVKRKAVYRDYENSYPPIWAVDERAVESPEFLEWVKTCPDNGIDLKDSACNILIDAKSICWATGWVPYDANKLTAMGYGSSPDIITNLMMERLCAPNGPTKGRLLKPSDGEPVKSVAFLQCAGSRDENHLPYCSGVCCAVSLKQASYVLERNPEAEVYIFYIDIRTPGRLEDFYQDRQEIEKIHLQRGKAVKVTKQGSMLEVTSENTLTGALSNTSVDLVVLATGMQPSTSLEKPPIAIDMDENGFLVQVDEARGIFGTGTCVRPMEVSGTLQDATGASIKAVQIARRA